jgi:hypothetical protein
LTYTGTPSIPASQGNRISIAGANSTVSKDINEPTGFSPSAGGYLSFLFNVVDNTQLSATTPDYFISFGGAAGAVVTTLGARIGIKSSGAGYRLSIENNSGGTPTFTEYATDLSFGTTYLIVAKLTTTSPMFASLWVNPTSLGGFEPTPNVTNNSGTGIFNTIASVCIRNAAGTPKADIDEIRVGLTWADVTAATYTWNQTGTADFTISTNWTPARTTPALTDILVFNNGVTNTVTNIPAQTVGSIVDSAHTTVNLQAGAANTLSVGTSVTVASGSALNVSGTNVLTFTVLTGAKASISGSMDYAGAAHKLLATDAGSITFQNGSVFTQNLLCLGNVFGPTGGPVGGVVFANGSEFISKAGSNPFVNNDPAQLVTFQTGSLYSHQQTGAPSFSGKVYSNFEINSAAFNFSSTGGSGFWVDNFSMIAGTLNFNLTTATNPIQIKGNLSVSSGAALNFIPASASAITFAGTAAQTITNAGTLTFGANEGLTINNSAGVTLNSPITISGVFTLTNGLLTTTATNLLTLGATATVSGGSSTSFVNGPVALTARLTTPMVAPIGKGSAYRPLTSVMTSLTGSGTLTAEQFETAPTGVVNIPGVDKISTVRYFRVDKSAGITGGNANLTLSWGADDGVTDAANLTVCGQADGGDWIYQSHASYVQLTGSTGTVTTGNNPATNATGNFALGNLTGGTNPLPVNLSSFTASPSNGAMKLSWKTSVETDNHGFNVERSADKSVWATLTFIQGQGNSNSTKAYSYSDNSINKAGKYYYRLKQIDNNGGFKYSNMVEADFVLPTVYSLNQNYPNPFNPNTMISYSLPLASNVKISVYNAIGETVQILENGFKVAGNYSVSFNAANIPSGIYFYRIEAGKFSQVRKMMLLK